MLINQIKRAIGKAPKALLWGALAIFFIAVMAVWNLRASQALTINEIWPGQVLGNATESPLGNASPRPCSPFPNAYNPLPSCPDQSQSAYPAVRLVSNQSLKLNITPIGAQNGLWNYQIDWFRTLNRQGTVVLRKGTAWVNNQPLVNPAEKQGSVETGFVLTPGVRYNLEFYAKPDAQGTLLARKYFTVKKAPAVAFCDYPAPPANCHYEGMDPVTGCGGRLVGNGGGTCNPSPVACSQEAQLCPDGSYVSRDQNNNCQFKACPNVRYPVDCIAWWVKDKTSSACVRKDQCGALSDELQNTTLYNSEAACQAGGSSCQKRPACLDSTPRCLLPEPAAGWCAPSAAPVITSLHPASGPVGTQVTIIGSGFTPAGNIINFGKTAAASIDSADGLTLAFIIPSAINNCNYTTGACTNMAVVVNPADYQVTVINTKGTSNAATFTVTGGLIYNPGGLTH